MKKIILIVSIFCVVILIVAGFLRWQILAPRNEVYFLKIQRVDKNKKFISPITQKNLTPEAEIVTYIARSIGSAKGNENNIRIVYNQIDEDLNSNIGLKTNEMYEDLFDKLSKARLYLVPLDYHYPKYKHINDGFLEIKLSPADSSLRPFLLNQNNFDAKARYCLKDNDCLLYGVESAPNLNPVTVGNKYWIFGGSNYDEETQIYYDQDHQKNTTEPPYEICNLVYSEAKCVNNYCTGKKSWGNCWQPSYY